MNDAFCEQLIARKTDIKDLAVIILSVLATILLTAAGFRFIGMLAIFIPIVAIIAIWQYLVPRLKKEYEYYLLNYTLEISMILNKENRSSIMEFDIRKAEIVVPSGSPALSGFKPTKRMDFSSGNKNAKTYTIIIHLEHDLCNIIIEPDEKIVEQMKLWLGPKMTV